MKVKCVVHGMSFHAFHGAMEVERELGQMFYVDVALAMEMTEADASPSVNTDVRGSEIYEVTKNIMMGTKFNSHASLALAIARDLFARFKHVTDVDVTVGRRQLFIAGDVKEIMATASCVRSDFEEKG
ncbi:MAG: dihydroneopterin aldolase [Synergistaceae bacterium]|jgi:dihydroneopterin aldolase|nr:dihydroneopterin aldolase [Synergistaceae bacterium]